MKVSTHQSHSNEAVVEELLLRNRALASAAEGITIADALAPDRPLIYINEGFSRLTGYSVEETLGTNCRFLQGPDTDPCAVKQIHQAIHDEQYCEVELLNYRKDGTPFWNHLSITPIVDDHGQTTHFVGIQADITQRRQAEQQLRDVNQRLIQANQRMENDLRAAARIQQALLPANLIQFPGAKLGWSFLPCDELAGDILDVFELNEHEVAFYVLDVSGHGVQAALLSTLLSHWLSKSALSLKRDPVAVLEHLNQNFQIADDSPQFFTCCYGVLDLAERTLNFSAAGHPSPILLRGEHPSELQLPGYPVGIVTSPEYEAKLVQLEPGDRVFLYSDGAVEQANCSGEQFGLARLMQQLSSRHQAPLQACIDLSLRAVLDTTPKGATDDDISMLGIEVE